MANRTPLAANETEDLALESGQPGRELRFAPLGRLPTWSLGSIGSGSNEPWESLHGHGTVLRGTSPMEVGAPIPRNPESETEHVGRLVARVGLVDEAQSDVLNDVVHFLSGEA